MQSVGLTLSKPWRDEYESSLVFRGIFRGTNGSTALSDLSSYSAAVTAYNGAAISTAQSKWGTSSLGVTTGTPNDYVTVAYHSGFNFQSSDWCAELWFRPTTRPATAVILGVQNGGVIAPWTIYHNSSGVLTAYVSHDNVAWSGYTNLTGGAMSSGAWHHIALTRTGSDFKLWLNGSQVGTTYTSASALASAASLPVIIGSRGDAYPVDGHIDSVRIYNGTGRYTATFTPGEFSA